MAPMVVLGGVCVWQESGVRNQAVRFVLMRLAECSSSRREAVFTFKLLFKDFYKFCICNTFCKYNVAIICIILQHNIFIPVNFHE
jgi:hypothetical protein